MIKIDKKRVARSLCNPQAAQPSLGHLSNPIASFSSSLSSSMNLAGQGLRRVGGVNRPPHGLGEFVEPEHGVLLLDEGQHQLWVRLRPFRGEFGEGFVAFGPRAFRVNGLEIVHDLLPVADPDGLGYVPLGVDQAKLVPRVWEGSGNRLRHALEAVGDEELRIPDPPPFQGFEEIGPIARALPRHGPEIQNLPPSVPRYPDRHLCIPWRRTRIRRSFSSGVRTSRP